eukprot:2065718-Prymnesium_polylepis.1
MDPGYHTLRTGSPGYRTQLTGSRALAASRPWKDCSHRAVVHRYANVGSGSIGAEGRLVGVAAWKWRSLHCVAPGGSAPQLLQHRLIHGVQVMLLARTYALMRMLCGALCHVCMG